MTMQQFVNRYHVRASAKWADSNPNMIGEWKDHGASHWRVTLKHQGRQMTVPFSQGSAISHEPTAEDVLGCLVSDASGFENARSFEEWCSEYGYDTDSRTAERTYQIIEKQAEKVKRLLGDRYDEAVQAEW